jgi:SpoVK/Ycf46/Vps4 family AAA+-type ATPase
MTEQHAARIQELEGQVAAEPERTELRASLAQLLFEAARPEDALREASTVLQEAPDHVGALETAMRAALALEKFERAERYRRLLAVLRVPVEEKPSQKEEPTGEESLDLPSQAEAAGVTLKDVGGLGAVKRRLELSIFALMRNAEMKQYYGRTIRGGLLLYGPPGCGKTFIARATAGELGARFMAVGISDVMDMWLGESERKLHALFETARRNAPCVLFFDEIDALGRKRNLQRVSASHNVVNQLLNEMDSVGANNDGVFILGATNHLWDVDTALRRPGRFDRVIFVGPPEAEARKAILEFHMRGRVAEGVDLAALAGKSTDGFSGADLAHLCDTAAEHAMEESLETGQMRPIGRKDFQAALKEVRPSTRAWLETARDYAMFANEGGAYDDLLAYLRSVKLA